jgi:hypothetical protein
MDDVVCLQTRLLVPVVSAIARRVQFLLRQWPDNAVLALLARVCLRLLDLPLDTPVVRALCGELVVGCRFRLICNLPQDLKSC